MALSLWQKDTSFAEPTTGLVTGAGLRFLNAIVTELRAAFSGTAVISLTYSATPAFNGALNPAARTFELTVSGNVTGPTASKLANHATYLFVLLFTAAGKNAVWPAGFTDFPDLSATAYPSGLTNGAVVRALGYVRGTTVYCIGSLGDQ